MTNAAQFDPAEMGRTPSAGLRLKILPSRSAEVDLLLAVFDTLAPEEYAGEMRLIGQEVLDYLCFASTAINDREPSVGLKLSIGPSQRTKRTRQDRLEKTRGIRVFRDQANAGEHLRAVSSSKPSDQLERDDEITFAFWRLRERSWERVRDAVNEFAPLVTQVRPDWFYFNADGHGLQHDGLIWT